MRDAAGQDVPRETAATCNTCAMLPAAQPSATSVHFQAATKCCTFLPELHNFLVGNALDDAEIDPAGLASLERRIDARVAVTPLGVKRPNTYLLIYKDGGEPVFGRARELRCPHYLEEQGGKCGVWKSRESTCATWFCKHSRGATGGDIWEAIQRVLRIAEVNLAWWCVREVGLDTKALREIVGRIAPAKQKVTAAEIDGAPDAAYAKLWGTWAGREREFFRACGAKVRSLAWDDVVKICGPELAVAVDIMRSLIDASHSTELPARLEIVPFTVSAVRGDQAFLATYRTFDPVTVPVALLEVLDAFDGRETREVIDSLLRERDVELEPAFIRRLVDFGILRPREEPQR